MKKKIQLLFLLLIPVILTGCGNKYKGYWCNYKELSTIVVQMEDNHTEAQVEAIQAKANEYDNVSSTNYITREDYAKEQGVEIRLYDIIYKAVEEMEAAMKGMLDPEYEEQILGNAEVRQLFRFSKVGTIAGSYVVEGVIKNNAKARVIRDSVVIYDGTIGSIQREKDSVKEVKKGLECGITINSFNDIKEGDIIEAYEMVEKAR